MNRLGKLFRAVVPLLKKPKVFIPLGIILIGFFAWRTFFSGSQTPQYQTATAEKGTLITTVSGSGTISTAGSVSITTTVTGTVSTVYVKQGDTVTQGEKIADVTLDQGSQARQTAAYATYLNAQNSLAAAQSKLNSLQAALFKANQSFVTDRGVSNPTDQQKADPTYIEEQAMWLQAEADYNNQQGVIAQAQAAVTSAWYSYEQTSSEITAPASGVITNLSLAPGLAITGTASSTGNTPSTQTVGAITIANGQLQATVNLSEIDVTKVQVGQKVTVMLDAFPGKTFVGHVAAIDTNGVVSSGVTNYPVTITIDTTQNNIYPNMAVDAKIITAIKDGVLLVPSTAIQTANGSSTVRILRNGQPQSVQVETGDANDTQTEITSGLSEGDTVVTGSILPTTGGTRSTSSPFSGGFGGGAGGVRIFNGGGGFGGGARRGG